MADLITVWIQKKSVGDHLTSSAAVFRSWGFIRNTQRIRKITLQQSCLGLSDACDLYHGRWMACSTRSHLKCAQTWGIPSGKLYFNPFRTFFLCIPEEAWYTRTISHYRLTTWRCCLGISGHLKRACSSNAACCTMLHHYFKNWGSGCR